MITARDLSRLERDGTAAAGSGGGDVGGAGSLRQSVFGPSLGPRRAAARSSAPARRWPLWSARAPDGVIFVSGGTEANHLALLGRGVSRVLVSAVEHNSVLQAVPAAERDPGRSRRHRRSRRARPAARRRPAPGAGFGHARQQRDRRHPAGCAKSAGSRERTARCFIATRCRPPARLRSTRGAIGADLVSLSAHKLGGPPGIGALAVTGDAGVDGAVARRRPGARAPRRHREPARHRRFRRGGRGRRGRAIGDLRPGPRAARRSGSGALCRGARAVVIGAAAPRLPNTTAVAMPGVAAETQVIALDLDGVMVSAGAACSSGKVGPSHVLAAMGVPPRYRRSTIRVSLGWTTTEADIAHFLDAWTALYRRAAGRSRERTPHDRISRSALVGQESARRQRHADLSRQSVVDAARPARARGDAALFHRAFRQSAQREPRSTAGVPPRRSRRRAPMSRR